MTLDEQRERASEARHGGRVLTQNIAHYLLPSDSPSAELARDAMRDLRNAEAFWRLHFDPGMGLAKFARWAAEGGDRPRREYLDDAIRWPVIRVALGLPL